MFQVASFTYISYPLDGEVCNHAKPAMSSGMGATPPELDRRGRPYVRIAMKQHTDLSLWSIIERLQRRLERQGMSPAQADRAVAAAVRVLAAR
jgi:hypothetical protein